MSLRVSQQYAETAVAPGARAASVSQQYIEVACLPPVLPAPRLFAPPSSWVNAAKQAWQGKREPVIVVRVEDVATVERAYTTKGDWDGSAAVSHLDTASAEGSVLNAQMDAISPALGDFKPSYDYTSCLTQAVYASFSFAATIDCFLYQLFFDSINFTEYTATEAGSGGGVRSVTVQIRTGSSAGPVIGSSSFDVDFGSYFSIDHGAFSATAWFRSLSNTFTYPVGARTELAAGVTYYGTITIDSVLQIWTQGGYYNQRMSPGVNGAVKLSYVGKNVADCFLLTSTIDLGLTPSVASRFEVDDVNPSGASIAYTAYADDFTPPTTARGTVVDGGTIGAAGYRYCRILAGFAANNGAISSLQEIRIIGGDSQYQTYSTHKDLPYRGALPLLPEKPVGNLSSRIEIDKPTSVGELSFKMLWTKASGDLIATGYLRNKAIQIKHGFVGLPFSDYQTIFTGVWANYSADHGKRLLSVSTQNVLKRFMKVKLPRETFNVTTGAKETTPLVWSNVNAVQVILDCIEALGIPDRYLDRSVIEGLRDGALSAASYNVTRTLVAPEEAWTLIHELATLCGCFVVVLPTGKMTLVLYDAAATPVATLSANIVDFSAISGGQDKLYTRQLIYYAPNGADPGDNESDYDKGLLAINVTSETAYDESTEHRWYDKWSASGAVITALAARWDEWQGTPRFTLSAKNVPGHLLHILEGQIVWVTGLTVPTAAAAFGVPQKFKALVLKRAFNPSSCTLDFDLLQISDAETA